MRYYHWSELNQLGRSNQAHYLAGSMLPSLRLVDVQGWPGRRVAFFYLPTDLHREPRPFGMKVSFSLPPGAPVPDITALYDRILHYQNDSDDNAALTHPSAPPREEKPEWSSNKQAFVEPAYRCHKCGQTYTDFRSCCSTALGGS